MNAVHTPHRFAFALALLAGAAAVPVVAPADPSAPADSAVDSLVVFPDTLAPAPGDSVVLTPPDSTLAGPVAPDSTLAAAPDSVAGKSTPPVPWLEPWRPGPPRVGPAVLEWVRPVDFEAALAWLDGTSVRVAGEKGMDTFVQTGPFDVAPELLVDGLPARNPADLDPAIWDRIPTMITGLSTSRGSPAHAWGGTEIRGSVLDPLVGRTRLRARFTSTRYETYTREIGLRTPGSDQMLSFDFREFKTEEGYDYSGSPVVLADPDRGRSKQRQFRLAGRTRTGAGELGLEFGRGRRYARGDAVSADSRERWTGRLALTFDRAADQAAWHARLYHLDFRDETFDRVNRSSAESRDGARLGLRVERLPEDGGTFGGLVVEHQSARFLPPAVAAADTSHYEAWTGRVGAGWRTPADGDWTGWASAQAVFADHTRESVDLGGRVGGGRRFPGARLQVIFERIPRIPTLVETYGVYSRRVVTPTADGWSYDPIRLVHRPGGEMDFERQDRAGIELDGRLGRVRWKLAWSNWWLRRGIGWEAAAVSAGSGEARVVSGVEADLDMFEASVAWDRVLGPWRLRLLGRGHYLPGNLELAAGRPGGWPRGAVRGRMGVDREFFSPRNRIGIDVEADFMGEHFDDLTGPLGGVVPSSTVLDARAWLAIRDAEIFFAVDNVLDAERMETLGTWRRFRQFTLGLTWDFFN